MCNSPLDDEVISQASTWRRLIGCPAGVSHHTDYWVIQPTCLQFHPDFLVQINFSAWLDSYLTVKVGVKLHGQIVVPFSRSNLPVHGAGEQRLYQLASTHTHPKYTEIQSTLEKKKKQVSCLQKGDYIGTSHTPVFKFDGQALDIRLTVITGEVNMHWVVTVD